MINNYIGQDDVIMCEQLWDMMFSNAALDSEDFRNNRRAAGIPGIMNAISIGRTSNLLTPMHELEMAPSLLIGHLMSIGWAGRFEFARRIRIVYAHWREMSGG